MAFIRQPKFITDLTKLQQGKFGHILSNNNPAGGSGNINTEHQTPGGRFPMLADYLRANKGEGQRMANQIAGKIEKDATEAETDTVKLDSPNFKPMTPQNLPSPVASAMQKTLQPTQPTQNLQQAQTGQLQQQLSNVPKAPAATAPTPAPTQATPKLDLPKSPLTPQPVQQATQGTPLQAPALKTTSPLQAKFPGLTAAIQPQPRPQPVTQSAPAIKSPDMLVKAPIPTLQEQKAQQAQEAGQYQSEVELQQQQAQQQAQQQNKQPESQPAPTPTYDEARASVRSEKAQKAQDRAKAIGSHAGREALLKEEYGNSSRGESGLDAALMGAEAGGRLAELSKKYAGLVDKVAGKNAADKSAYDAERQRQADAARMTAENNAQYQGGGSQKNLMRGGDVAATDVNAMSDAELSSAGFAGSQAPGETTEHFNARMEARRNKINQQAAPRFRQ